MSAKMAFDLLCDISLASRGWKIRARIARMWDYTGTANDVPPMHVDLVLVDEKGNAMYAEIPGVEADKFRPLLQESKVYTFSKFLVLPSKPAYKPFPNKYMIKLTPWTNVEQVNEVPADFPSHVFNLVQFSDLSQRVGMQEYFTDVIGMIIGVSKLAYVRMASKTSDTPKRVIALRDLANCEVKLVLWGEHALDFDADAVHSVGQDNVVVGIFVGTLMKAYNKTLSGGSACKWYLNEDIPEINQFFDSLGDSAPKIQWISAGAKSFGSSQRPAQLEHKSVADLKKIDPWEAAGAGFSSTVTIAKLSPSQSWWFSSCSRCHRAATAYGSSYKCYSGCSSVTAIPKYRLCLIGTDGTDSAEFVLFGRVAQQVVGRPVMNLIKFQGRSDNIPKEIAAVVS
ncbi:replication protein A 70 kDa DNA-binding subunit D isoform X2 [Oryza sativa Japonica Group]|nr:replication protein A 70 kDa DNA-binding subunit D isoform X2 [Oryza sativa Japonica Group]